MLINTTLKSELINLTFNCGQNRRKSSL